MALFCVCLAKLGVHFPEFPSRHGCGLGLATGEICRTLGRSEAAAACLHCVRQALGGSCIMTGLLAHLADGGGRGKVDRHKPPLLPIRASSVSPTPELGVDLVLKQRTRFLCRSPAWTKFEAYRWCKTEAVSSLFLLFLLGSNLSLLPHSTSVFPCQLPVPAFSPQPQRSNHLIYWLYNQLP